MAEKLSKSDIIKRWAKEIIAFLVVVTLVGAMLRNMEAPEWLTLVLVPTYIAVRLWLLHHHQQCANATAAERGEYMTGVFAVPLAWLGGAITLYGLAVLVYQLGFYLYAGAWADCSVYHAFLNDGRPVGPQRWVPEFTTILPELTDWLIEPRGWFGLHKMVVFAMHWLGISALAFFGGGALWGWSLSWMEHRDRLLADFRRRGVASPPT